MPISNLPPKLQKRKERKIKEKKMSSLDPRHAIEWRATQCYAEAHGREERGIRIDLFDPRLIALFLSLC